MTILRTILAVLGLAFGATIVWAIAAGNFGQAGSFLTTDPWGIVTLADLYFGFVLFALIIFFFERSWWAAFWIVPIPFLGNVWVVIWLIYRLPQIAQRLKPV